MWEKAISELEKRRRISELGGGPERMEKQHNNGKLSARERIELLLDPETFTEIDNFIESRINDFNLDKKRVPGDGVITGYGRINGRLVFVSSEDFTVIGGTLGEYHSQKICHIQDMALDMKAPIIMINDSGGARIEEGVSSLGGYSGIFLRNTRASGIIPQIAVIAGPCSGGACYSPAICDFIFMVDIIGQMFITGPQVVKAFTNEVVSYEELGGAGIQSKKSGVAHFVCDSENKCMEEVRRLLSFLPDNYLEKPPSVSHKKTIFSNLLKTKKADYGMNSSNSKKVEEDFCRELINIVPADLSKPYDVHLVINKIFDANSFMEIQKEFARNAVIGFGRLNGICIGIVANQPMHLAGAVDCDAADKIARFIRTCDCFNTPLITLVDVPGFYPGTEQEHHGIIRHGAKILYAYSEATVPKITLIMRKAYGGAYIAMNSMKMGADIVYAWPIAEIAVMGAEGAVNIIYKHEIERSVDPEEERRRFTQDYNSKFMNPYHAAARGYITEVINPDETRRRLISSLLLLGNKSMAIVPKKHGNIPL
jgi:acetyl-CoA carboxylase carboxyltransferase component